MGVLLQTNAASMNPATFTITKTLDFYPMGLTVNTVPQFGSSAFKTDQVFVIVGNVNTTVNAARINYVSCKEPHITHTYSHTHTHTHTHAVYAYPPEVIVWDCL